MRVRGVYLKGGYDSDLITRTGGNTTTLNGNLKLTSGGSTLENIIDNGELTVQGGGLRSNGIAVR